jgi:hypothetical protein
MSLMEYVRRMRLGMELRAQRSWFNCMVPGFGIDVEVIQRRA